MDDQQKELAVSLVLDLGERAYRGDADGVVATLARLDALCAAHPEARELYVRAVKTNVRALGRDGSPEVLGALQDCLARLTG